MPSIPNIRIYIKLTPKPTRLNPTPPSQYYTTRVSQLFTTRHPPRHAWLDRYHQTSIELPTYTVGENLTIAQFRNLAQQTHLTPISEREYPQ